MTEAYTVQLPKTSFPMRAKLVSLEETLLKRWEALDLYRLVSKKNHGKKHFGLHAGPPYANGHLHMGHAFSGVLKDTIIRFHRMAGYDAPFVPGWDCHGLPIEWAVENLYIQEKKDKKTIPIKDFRQRCRQFAEKWVDIQKQESKRLGMLADWDHPYLTMDKSSEASIAACFLKLFEKGYVYRGVKPVLWSVVEHTALAEAEVEFREHTSDALYVALKIVTEQDQDLKNAYALIWTTTPWSLPANQAIAYGQDMTYDLIRVDDSDHEQEKGRCYLLAHRLRDHVMAQRPDIRYSCLKQYPGRALKNLFYVSLFEGEKSLKPFVPGNHVTEEAGTGLVHTAPSHGPEDFELSKKYSLDVPETIDAHGLFQKNVPLVGGQHVFKVNPTILAFLKETHQLFHHERYTHSYPHSWRSKAPLIYRATAQWFMSMVHGDLVQKSLDTLQEIDWFPKDMSRRLMGMLKNRPDWCLSRQRSWGVPLPIFLDKKTLEPLVDEKVTQRILEKMSQEGADAWFHHGHEVFLGEDYDPDAYEKVTDILDVWFESGATQAFVLKDREDQHFPSDLVLEGSDQHRGWFQSSLLMGLGLYDKPPFKGVLTHGFVLDKNGHKMSKSLGNVLSPQDIIQDMGADMLRLWVISTEYRDDVRISKDILKQQADVYRRFRNIFRYLLGALKGFDDQDAVAHDALPDLEKYMLHRLWELDQEKEKAMASHTWQRWFHQLHTFCTLEISSFYLDIRKDVLYCDGLKSPSRRACQTVLSHLLQYLMRWLAPILVFTMEEVYHTCLAQKKGLSEERKDLFTHPDFKKESVHLLEALPCPAYFYEPSIAQSMASVRSARKLVLFALEKARHEGLMGSGLEASVILYDPKGHYTPTFEDANVMIVSHFQHVQKPLPEKALTSPECPDMGVVVEKSQDKKCPRCWRYVVKSENSPLCGRCEKVIRES